MLKSPLYEWLVVKPCICKHTFSNPLLFLLSPAALPLIIVIQKAVFTEFTSFLYSL